MPSVSCLQSSSPADNDVLDLRVSSWSFHLPVLHFCFRNWYISKWCRLVKKKKSRRKLMLGEKPWQKEMDESVCLLRDLSKFDDCLFM